MEIKLRPWSIQDSKSLITYANNPAIAKNMTDQFPHPFTSEHAIAFISKASQNNPATILAIDLNGEAIGGIGIHPQADIHQKNAELGYWLAEPFWGKGYATKAILLMIAYGFDHFEVNRIYARPFGTNLASQKALKKAGFTLEAHLLNTIFKNGQLLDELIFAVRR